MSDENEELNQVSDFYSGISDVKSTSRVTHQGLYDEVLGALMERVMELEKIISRLDDTVEDYENKIDLIEAKLNVIIIAFWILIVFVVTFLVIALKC